jgi:hypothetical protein
VRKLIPCAWGVIMKGSDMFALLQRITGGDHLERANMPKNRKMESVSSMKVALSLVMVLWMGGNRIGKG